MINSQVLITPQQYQPDSAKVTVVTATHRIFVNSGFGCTARCAYCYLGEYISDRSTINVNYSGEELRQAILDLEKRNLFIRGKLGSLISFGCFSEPFHLDLVKRTIEYVRCLVDLGNPIEIPTKLEVSETAANTLGKLALYRGQITVHTGITTFAKWYALEPGTSSPERRLIGLKRCLDVGLAGTLLIKPAIVGITDKEKESFANAIKLTKVPTCIVGTMYISESIRAELLKRGLLSEDLCSAVTHTTRYPFPLNQRKKVVNTSVLEYMNCLIEYLRLETQATIVKSSPCAVAHSLGIPCPTKVWADYSDLCVGCQPCCEWFYSMPEDIQCAYEV